MSLYNFTGERLIQLFKDDRFDRTTKDQCFECGFKDVLSVDITAIQKMLLETDDPEFDDCIRVDKDCYNMARILEKKDLLSINKCKLLADQKRKHIMVRMFGHQWWRRK